MKCEKIGRQAMVSTARTEASKIGASILQMGGNAVDAAVAVGFALGVCEPSTSGLGGGGFMMIHREGVDCPIVLDFRENAPRAATKDMWHFGEDGKVINKENQIGGASVAVPGEVAGLTYALEHYGTLPLNVVMEPAAQLAERGFVVTPMMEKHFSDNAEHLEKDLGARYTYQETNTVKAGRVVKNPELANLLRRIANEGRDYFYHGPFAERLVACVQEAGGLLTMRDLAEYEVKVRKPVHGQYRGYDIYSMGLPSSGGTHIIQTLNILESFDMSSLEVNGGPYLHIFSETLKKVYTDRAKFMADGDFYDVPIEGLCDKRYAAQIANQLDWNKCSSISQENPWDYEHPDTTHFSIGDSAGNMVSVTKTINHFCGACIAPVGTGMLLNDTMADFSVKHDSINCVEPWKKPLSTMSPTVILKDGKPFAALGSPGGERIICNVVQVISKLIDHKMGIDDAIASPRITENVKDKVVYEGLIPEESIQHLQQLGHTTERVLDLDVKMGGVQGVLYCDDGTIHGAADPRRDGEAIGY